MVVPAANLPIVIFRRLSRARRLAVGAAVVVATSLTVPAGATPYPGIVGSSCSRTNAGYRCSIGPFDVDANETLEMMTGVAAPSEAGYLTWGKARLVDASGRPLGGHTVHLHHAVWLNPHERDMTCDSYDGGAFPGYERFFATGKELTKLVLPDGHGYLWDPQVAQPYTQSAPWWAFVTHLDGMHGASNFYIQFDMGFVAESDAEAMTAVEPVWLDVRNCNSDPVYDVRKGSGSGGVHKERWTYEMPATGRFVFFGGHLHDGGLRISLKNRTSRDHLYTSKATYGSDDDPWSLTRMSTWSKSPGSKVRRGDELRLTAVYDSTRAREDVMGIMVAAFVPAR